jgi:hypothetical protein
LSNSSRIRRRNNFFSEWSEEPRCGEDFPEEIFEFRQVIRPGGREEIHQDFFEFRGVRRPKKSARTSRLRREAKPTFEEPAALLFLEVLTDFFEFRRIE